MQIGFAGTVASDGLSLSYHAPCRPPSPSHATPPPFVTGDVQSGAEGNDGGCYGRGLQGRVDLFSGLIFSLLRRHAAINACSPTFPFQRSPCLPVSALGSHRLVFYPVLLSTPSYLPRGTGGYLAVDLAKIEGVTRVWRFLVVRNGAHAEPGGGWVVSEGCSAQVLAANHWTVMYISVAAVWSWSFVRSEDPEDRFWLLINEYLRWLALWFHVAFGGARHF